MTRRITPVVGSRSMRASVGIRVVGVLEAIKMESFRAVVPFEEFDSADAVFSTPPVREFNFDVSPRRR